MSLTVGVAGVTGKFGRVLVSSLLKYPNITVRGYCRDPAKVPSSFVSNAQFSVSAGEAFSSDLISSFVTGCDVVVCCYLGDDNLMIEGQKLLINACETKGVPRYIASDWCLDYTKLEFGYLFPKDPMKHIKKYLDTKEKVKGVHILVGGFIQGFFGGLFRIWDPTSTTFRYWGTGDELWEGTTYENAAEYTAAICADKDAVGIQKVVGGRAKFRDIVDSFEKVYNVKPKLECLGSLEDLYTRMHNLRSADPHNFYAYIFLYYQYYALNGETNIGSELDNERYPQVKPVSWEDFMAGVPLEDLANTYFGVGENIS
ncbi:nmrA-like family protein [Bisporella sp. PMI_857]|nr:nmrA-like family protein [Bisporella sp. PMI_857]